MSNIISTVVEDIESFFGTEVGQEVTSFFAEAAGAASAWAIIENASPSDKSGTASDIYTLANAGLSLLSGSTPPTLAQIQSVFLAFKSSSATSAYASLAQTFSAALSNYVAKYSGTPWIEVSTAYINGWQLAAAMLGGAASASPSISVAPAPVAAAPVAADPASEPAAATSAS